MQLVSHLYFAGFPSSRGRMKDRQTVCVICGSVRGGGVILLFTVRDANSSGGESDKRVS